MTTIHSKFEKFSFSDKEDDFAAFSGQFEARMDMLNLGKCLEDKLTVHTYKEDETRGKNCQGQSRGRAEEADSWSGASLLSAWTMFQSTSSAITSKTGWKPGKPLWGNIAAPRGPASRRCSHTWPE